MCLMSKPDVTSGVSGVDDAQDSGVAVRPGFIQGVLQLADVQAPALLFIQVVVDLHCSQFGQSGRVEGILGDGDHHARAGRTFAAREQFQHGLEEKQTHNPTVLLISDPLECCAEC